MQLPKFPEFSALKDITDEQLTPYTAGFPVYSDFVYSNLWSWNIDNSFIVADLNGNLVVRMRDPKTKDFFYSLHGINEINESLQELFSYIHSTNQEGVSTALSLVPEETASLIDVSQFEATEDRNNFDYVYSTKQLSEIVGKPYKSKRHLVNQFKINFPNYLIEHTDLTPSTKMLILKFMSKENKKRSAFGYTPFVEYEMAALERFFLQPYNPNLIASFIISDNQLLGYTIDEIIGTYALSHFFKVDSEVKGAYDTLNIHVAGYLYEKSVRHWNWVEDVGSDGLRQAKLSYRPTHFLKKYKVSELISIVDN